MKKWSITLPRIVRFCSNFVQSLNTWRRKYHKRIIGSKVKVTARRNASRNLQIVNNSAGDCSISIKFTTDYDHVTSDLPQTFKVNGSKVKVIALYDVLA